MNAAPAENRCTRLPQVTCEFANSCGSAALTNLLEGTNVQPCLRHMLAAINPRSEGERF